MARDDKIYLDACLWQRSIFRLRKGLENTFHSARADNISISTGFIYHNSCCYPSFYACYSLGQATRSKIFEIKTRFKEFGSQNRQTYFKVINEPEAEQNYYHETKNYIIFQCIVLVRNGRSSFTIRVKAIDCLSFEPNRLVNESFHAFLSQFKTMPRKFDENYDL